MNKGTILRICGAVGAFASGGFIWWGSPPGAKSNLTGSPIDSLPRSSGTVFSQRYNSSSGVRLTLTGSKSHLLWRPPGTFSGAVLGSMPINFFNASLKTSSIAGASAPGSNDQTIM